MKRQKLSGKSARRTFARGAKTHKKNTVRSPMRGGIRL